MLYGGGGALGLGTIYRLTLPAAGGPGWAETVLYSFTGGADGASPQAGLILDPAGNFYGTASAGGQNFPAQSGGCGKVFQFRLP